MKIVDSILNSKRSMIHSMKSLQKCSYGEISTPLFISDVIDIVFNSIDPPSIAMHSLQCKQATSKPVLPTSSQGVTVITNTNTLVKMLPSVSCRLDLTITNTAS